MKPEIQTKGDEPTPETDAIEKQVKSKWKKEYTDYGRSIMAEEAWHEHEKHARTLERERDAYKVEIAKLAAERDTAIVEMSKQARAAGHTDSQREILEKCVHALEWLHREHGIEPSAALQEARALLARTKGAQ